MSKTADASLALPELRNPFPGLRQFEREEAAVFFGREDDRYALLQRLRQGRFLAVVGASGCGKSSLIRAGLLADLEEGFPIEHRSSWRIAKMRPSGNPIRNLARALEEESALGAPPHGAIPLSAVLRRSSLGLVEAVQEAPLRADEQLLLLVDQFEELVRIRAVQPADALKPRNEAQAFVKLLLAAAEQTEVPIYVALTLRAVFLGDCVNFTGLPEAVNQGIYLVPRMARAQLREAIVGPVEDAGGTITDRLVNRLLNDLGDDDPDQLPILQHALMRLWDLYPRGTDVRLDLQLYEQIGGLSGALGQHLDEVLQRAAQTNSKQLPARMESSSWGGGEIVETVFRSLTFTTPENRVVRRPTEFARLVQRCHRERPGCDGTMVAKIVDEFRASGCHFLMPPRERVLEDSTVVDISHEAIIRQWPKLREWARQEAREREIAERLARAAERWDRDGRQGHDLYHDSVLAETVEWFGTRASEISILEREFLAASQADQENRSVAKAGRSIRVF